MSGRNTKTGYFELTGTKARFWTRREDVPPDCLELSGLDRACCILQHFGVKVVANHGSWAEIAATQGQIWEALSGQPSNPQRESYHDDR